MRPNHRFYVGLAAFVLLYLVYGLKRFTLGIDFTDEGAYVAWPLRTVFGERPFTAELGTLLRPLVIGLSAIFRLHPDISLYEFRLLGWLVHLGAFSALSIYLFRLSRAPLQSLLIASVPLFVCHIFGLAPPSYNSTSSDFLLIAFSLRGLGAMDELRGRFPLNVASGLALFVATLAHPVLGLVGGIIGLYECANQNLLQNVLRRRLTASNLGVLTFVGCWAILALYLLATGAIADWFARTALFRSLSVRSLGTNPGLFLFQLLKHPFSYNPFAIGATLAALAAMGSVFVLARTHRTASAERAVAILALLLVVSLIGTYSFDSDYVPIGFAMVSLVAICTHLLRIGTPIIAAEPPIRFLLAASGLGALFFATVTYFFSPYRSWMSGILALPFAFAVGLTLLLRSQPGRSTALLRVLTTAALFLVVACIVREHYAFIYRDAAPADLVTTFKAPKLRHIRSTPERTQAIDALYDYLHSKLIRGRTLLVFDDAPLLYYLFDAMPAYNLTWATRYTQSLGALEQLDRELRANPLPTYAIRTLVDLGNPAWSNAPRTKYDNYPLNETVMTNYELERVIFPFEIWRLKQSGR